MNASHVLKWRYLKTSFTLGGVDNVWPCCRCVVHVSYRYRPTMNLPLISFSLWLKSDYVVCMYATVANNWMKTTTAKRRNSHEETLECGRICCDCGSVCEYMYLLSSRLLNASSSDFSSFSNNDSVVSVFTCLSNEHTSIYAHDGHK